MGGKVVVEFRTDRRFVRRARELKTLAAMMRWSGPRVALRHPLLALLHLLDGRRPAPLLPNNETPTQPPV